MSALVVMIFLMPTYFTQWFPRRRLEALAALLLLTEPATARINDEGWDTSYREWLKLSRRLSSKDMVLVLSVGGCVSERNISANLARAVEYARQIASSIGAVVGRDGGHTGRVADA